MKKLFTTAVATAVLLTSAVPAFAQDSNQVSTQTAASSKAVNPSSVDMQSYVTAYVAWNSVPGAVTYSYHVWDYTEGRLYEAARQGTTNRTTGALTYGKRYSITIAALDSNDRIITQRSTGEFVASPSTNSFYIPL